jgi:hypothetical protein
LHRTRAKDELSKEFSDHGFNDFAVDEKEDPELYQFVETIKNSGPRFNDYAPELLEKFADKIYELRKNNPDNSAG